MPLHNSKYCKSITTNKVKSKSIHQFFTPGGTSSDKEQLSVHKIDVSRKSFATFSVKEILVAYVFTPNPLCIFAFVFEEKENMRTSFNFNSNLGVIGQLS